MSDIAVTVTSQGAIAATIGVGGNVAATVSSGGSVSVNLPGGASSWDDVTGKPTTFPPSSHTHTASQITDRSTALVTSINGQTGDVTITEGGGGSSYTLPTATTTVLGGVKIGSGIAIADGVISISDSTIDGGEYLGEIVDPGDSISVTTHPSNQTSDVTETVSLGLITPNVGQFNLRESSIFAFGENLFAPVYQLTESEGTYYETGGLFKSEDDGSTWSEVQFYFQNDPAIGSGDYFRPEDFLTGVASNGSTNVFVHGFNSSGQVGNSKTSNSPTLGGASAVVIDASQGSNAVRSIAYNQSAGRWVAVLIDGAIYSSSNATSWTQRRAGSYYESVLGVFVINGVFVVVNAMSTSGNGYSAYSVDGVSWTPVSRPYQYTSAAASSGRVVALEGSTEAHYSLNGATWQTSIMPIACSRIAYASGRFWAWSGALSTDILSSPDGVTWTVHDAPIARSWRRAAGVEGSGKILFTSETTAECVQAVITSESEPVSFVAAAVSSNGQPVSYQWESSADGGSTWQTIAGATSSSLAIASPGLADNGKRYRAILSATGTQTVITNAATLTVNSG